MRSSPLTQQKRSTKGNKINIQGYKKNNTISSGVSRAPSKLSKKIVSPYSKKIKRYVKHGVKSALLSPVFHGVCKTTVIVGVLASVLYGSYHYIGKTFANEVIVSQGEIVSRVSKLMEIPKDSPYEIVRVQDENDLRKQNPFYKDIKEGDYILMYKTMAIIYDLRNNEIIAVKKIGE